MRTTQNFAIAAALPGPPLFSAARAFARWPVAMPGRCEGEWGMTHCLISEISEGGLRLTPGREHHVGDRLIVAWTRGPNQPSVRVVGAVKHVTDTEVGLEFVSLRPSDRQQIAAIVAACNR